MGDLLEAENLGLLEQIGQLNLQIEHLQVISKKIETEKEVLATEKAQLLNEKEAWSKAKKELEDRVASSERIIQQLRATVLFLQEELVAQAQPTAAVKSPSKLRPVVSMRKQPKGAAAAGSGGAAGPSQKGVSGAGTSLPRAKAQAGSSTCAHGNDEDPEPGVRLSRRAAETVKTALQESEEAVQAAAESDKQGKGCLWWDAIRRKGARVEVMTDVGNSWEPGTVTDISPDQVQVRYDSLQTDDGEPLTEWHTLPWAAGKTPERHGVGFKLRPPQPKETWGDPIAMKKGDTVECWVQDEGAFYPVEILGKKRGRVPNTSALDRASSLPPPVPASGSGSGQDGMIDYKDLFDSGTEGGDDGEGVAGPSGRAAGAAAANKMCWVSFEAVDGDVSKAHKSGSSVLVSMSNLRVPYAWLGSRWERLLGERPGPGRKPSSSIHPSAAAGAAGATAKVKTKMGRPPGSGRPLGRPPGAVKASAAGVAAVAVAVAAAGPSAPAAAPSAQTGPVDLRLTAQAPAAPQPSQPAGARGQVLSSTQQVLSSTQQAQPQVQPAAAPRSRLVPIKLAAASPSAASPAAATQSDGRPVSSLIQHAGGSAGCAGWPLVASPSNALKALAVRQTGLAAPPPRPVSLKPEKKQRKAEKKEKKEKGTKEEGSKTAGSTQATPRQAAVVVPDTKHVASVNPPTTKARTAKGSAKGSRAAGGKAENATTKVGKAARVRKPEPERPMGVQKIKADAKPSAARVTQVASNTAKRASREAPKAAGSTPTVKDKSAKALAAALTTAASPRKRGVASGMPGTKRGTAATAAAKAQPAAKKSRR